MILKEEDRPKIRNNRRSQKKKKFILQILSSCSTSTAVGVGLRWEVRTMEERHVGILDATTVEEVENALARGESVEQRGDFDKTPLMVASEKGLLDVVNCLLDHGANPNHQARHFTRYTPLHSACQGGHVRIIERLVEAGANLNPTSIVITPLSMACSQGAIDVIECLLRLGADTEHSVEKGSTPLIWACDRGQVDAVDRLLSAGALVNTVPSSGNDTCALFAVCENGRVDILDRLVIYGADLRFRGRLGRTALMIACEKGHLEVADRLLGLGCDVNERDNRGDTALFKAARRNRSQVVKLLITHGADPSITNFDDKSVFDLALSEEIIQLLQQ